MIRSETVYYCNCVNFTIKPTNMYKNNRNHRKSLLNHNINDHGLYQITVNVQSKNEVANDCAK